MSISNIPKCKNCGRQDEIHSGIKKGQPYEELCTRCIGTLGSAEFNRRYDRQYQRREYAQDILQPDDEGFAKVYGVDKAKQYGWTDDQIRRNT